MDKAYGLSGSLQGASTRALDYQNVAGATAAPKQSPMQEHAQRLHAQAEELASLNSRLSNLLERMCGPSPEAPSAGSNAQASPSGVLYVAAFGSERIGIETDKLRSFIGRLENLA